MPLPSQVYKAQIEARESAQASGNVVSPMVKPEPGPVSQTSARAKAALDAYLKTVQDAGRAVVTEAKDPSNQRAAVQTYDALMQVTPGTRVGHNTPKVMLDAYRAGQTDSAKTESNKASVPVVKRPAAEPKVPEKETVFSPGTDQSGYIRYLSHDALEKLRREQNPAMYSQDKSPNYVEITPDEQWLTDTAETRKSFEGKK